jgi:hypothetical protein
MQRFIGDAPINDDFSLKLEYISGLVLNRHHLQPSASSCRRRCHRGALLLRDGNVEGSPLPPIEC